MADLGSWWSGQGDETKAAAINGLFGLTGATLAGIGQGKQADQNAALTREQAYLQAAQGQQGLALQQQQIGMAGSQLDPLAQQKSRQQQALFAAILPGLRNASVSAPQGFERFVPQMSGGLRIPEGGFDASTLAYFSPQARAGAEGAFYNSTPGQAPPDLSQVGYGQSGAGVTAPAAQAHQDLQTSQQARQAAILQALGQAQQQGGGAQPGGGGGGSKWGTVAKVASFAAPLLMSYFGGKR